MATNTDAIAKALMRGRREVMDEISNVGEEIVEDFRQIVSTRFPPQSAPGTPPHMRTGGYRASLASRTAGSVITIFSRSGNLATWLEFGTRKMAARPHWRTRLPVIVTEKMGTRVGSALVRGEAGAR